jgi:N utilization substance protein B
VSGAPADQIRKNLADAQGHDKADQAMFIRLLEGAIGSAAELDALLAPLLDRKAGALSPVEHAILLLAAFELKSSAATPYRVVINEAVELAKTFGGTDGHKYVNGVLDKLARAMRPDDLGPGR